MTDQEKSLATKNDDHGEVGSYVDFNKLEGLVFTEIAGLTKGSDEVIFKTLCGKWYKMYHSQDCCESVSLEDIEGDIADLINAPVLMAEESENSGEEEYGTYTWTFYRFQTTKGFVVIRWYGSSNGYYSESVYLERIN